MNTKKNIDRLFQEKFKDFEIAPNDAVWDRINESLPNKKKKRRVIAFWWQIGGVAAAIALLLTAGVSIFNSDDHNTQEFPIVNTKDKNNSKQDNATKSSADVKQDELNGNDIDKLDIVNSDTDQESILDEKALGNSTTLKKAKKSNQLTTSSKTPSNAVANRSNKSNKPPASQKLNKEIHTLLKDDNTSKVAENTDTNKTTISKKLEESKLTSKSELKSDLKTTIEERSSVVVANAVPNKIENSKTENAEAINSDTVITEIPEKASIQDAIAEHIEVIDEKEKEDEQNRWSIAPNVAPVYYGSLGQGSSLDQQFNDNSKASDINMSYGIIGAYAVSKKLKIRAGINSVNLNQSTANVFAFAGPGLASRGVQDAQASGNITYNQKQNVLLMSSEMLSISSAPEAFNTKIAGDVDQRFGFIEVPLELEYRLVDRKFGINVIGGFSTFFLNENEIYADIDGTSTLIGEANNINSTSFSANFGLGLDYSLSKQWNINLEPQFKYQINTFNNTTGDFRPFFIGVYTGLSFKF